MCCLFAVPKKGDPKRGVLPTNHQPRADTQANKHNKQPHKPSCNQSGNKIISQPITMIMIIIITILIQMIVLIVIYTSHLSEH